MGISAETRSACIPAFLAPTMSEIDDRPGGLSRPRMFHWFVLGALPGACGEPFRVTCAASSVLESTRGSCWRRQ